MGVAALAQLPDLLPFGGPPTWTRLRVEQNRFTSLSLSGAALAASSTRQLNRISSPDCRILYFEESIPQTPWK